MRVVLGALVAATLTVSSVEPAQAEYCGPISDTKRVEKLTIARPPYDRSRIMYLAVVDSFAMAELEWKGELSLYFAKRSGTWTYAGSTPPATMPASVKKRYDAIMNASPHSCANPYYVPHPSGR
jgi:hypothetical protein